MNIVQINQNFWRLKIYFVALLVALFLLGTFNLYGDEDRVSLFAAAEDYITNRNYSAAIQILEPFIEKGDTTPDTLLFRGVICKEVGMLDNAYFFAVAAIKAVTMDKQVFLAPHRLVLLNELLSCLGREYGEKIEKIMGGAQEGCLIQDKYGTEILIDCQDNTVSRLIQEKGEWEPRIHHTIKQLVKPKQKVLVLGAHIGYHVLKIADIVGPEGRVFAFEANPRTFKFLKANVAFNDLNNVVLYGKAVYSADTELNFVNVLGNTGMSYVLHNAPHDYAPGKTIAVQAVAIDSISEIESIDFLLMDIEGAEAQAVYGAKKLIDNSPNLIVLQEWTPAWMSNDEIDEYLMFWRSRGYKIAQVLNAGFKEMSDDDLKKASQIDIVLAKHFDKIIA